MGVNPEPALCADDVCRRAPRAIEGPLHEFSAAGSRAICAGRKAVRQSSRKPSLVAALIVGLSLGAGVPSAVAHEGGPSDPAIDAVPSQLSEVRQPAAWGGIDLKAEEPATRAILDNDPASPPEPEIDSDTIRFGERAVPRALVDAILRAAQVTDVDPVYLMALADKESSFSPTVRSAASSAQGLFQFLAGTWLEMIRDCGAKHGLVAEAAAIQGGGGAMRVADAATRKRILDLRNDPYVAGLMAGELIKRDRAKIEARIGRGLKTTELYIAHFLGTASAGKFLTLSAENPETVARQEFGGAARANRSIFTASGGGKSRSLTVAEVHARLDDMIDRRMDAYEDVVELAAQPTEDDRMGEGPLLDARLRVLGAIPAPMTTAVQ